MSIITQINLTVLLELIVLAIITRLIYKIADNKNWSYKFYVGFEIIIIISFILIISWVVCMLLALIWHWY